MTTTSIPDQATTPMAIVPPVSAVRRVVYPRPRWQHPMALLRLASLLVLLVILAAATAAFFSTPHTWRDPFFAPTATPVMAPCAKVTLIRVQGTFTTKIDEACK